MYELIGHRGYPAFYPENTILSFRKAVETGCDGIELDVRLTKDNKVVVFHDERLERTTDGKGFVRDFRFKELQKLDAGRGEKIPLLDEVLAVIKDVKFLIEIKVSRKDTRKEIDDLCKKTLWSVRNKKNVFLISFNLFALTTAKQIEPKIKTGLIFSKHLEEPERFARFLDILCPRLDMLNSGVAAFAKQHNLDIYIWTVNTIDDFRKAARYDIKGIVSNDPGKMRGILCM